MDDYLSKPFTQDQLSNLLSKWLPAAPALPPKAPPAAPAPEPRGQLLDQRALASLRGLRDGLLVKVLDTWLQESPQLLEQLKQALQEQDLSRLHRAAHSLKNSAATLGAGQLAAACLQVEQLARQEQLDAIPALMTELDRLFTAAHEEIQWLRRITSYNVCYTKLLRGLPFLTILSLTLLPAFLQFLPVPLRRNIYQLCRASTSQSYFPLHRTLQNIRGPSTPCSALH